MYSYPCPENGKQMISIQTSCLQNKSVQDACKVQMKSVGDGQNSGRSEDK